MLNWNKAKQIMEVLNKKLPGQAGNVVAIETDSGDYFVGEDVVQASKLAQEKYPDKEFIFERIGFETLYFIGAYDKRVFQGEPAVC